jgi:hypothetical protein
MFSKCVFEMLGLNVNVYGLGKYKSLPEYTPLKDMFFCHGFGRKLYPRTI